MGCRALGTACFIMTMPSFSPLERAVVTYWAPSTSSKLPRMTRMLRATPPRPAMRMAGQMWANMSTTRPQLQGAITYSGEKNDTMLGCLKVKTMTYKITMASEKRGTEVKMKAMTDQKLSQRPY